MNKNQLADMKQLKLFSIFILLGIAPYIVKSQTNSAIQSKSFSLKEAVEYALTNHPGVKNAEEDVQSSDYKRKEIRGIGLPQISSSFDVKDYEKLPTQLLPGDFFGKPGQYIPVQFGVKYNATGTIQASQIVFNSDYIVALQSSKSFMELSEKSLGKTKIETTVLVTKAYYNALVSKERAKLIDANVDRLKKLLDDTKALFNNGFVEQIDIDRITVAYNNLLSEKEKIERVVGLTEMLLKFQMGLSIKTSITLTDVLKLEELSNVDTASVSNFDYKNRIEYSLLLSQRKLNELDIKKNNMRYFPSIVLYGNLSSQAQRNSFDFFDTDKKWYPIGIIGGTITLPIFDGFQNHYRSQQSKINLIKTQNNLLLLENAIDLEIQTSQTSYLNALNSLQTQKSNMELAQGVYNVAKKKYDQGVGSNLEVMNAETSLKEAQTNYYNAMYEYYVAKVDFEKATGKIK